MTQAETETAMRDCDGTELRPGDQVEFVNDCIDEVRGRIATVAEDQEIPLGNQLAHLFDPDPLVHAELDGEMGCVRASDIRKVQTGGDSTMSQAEQAQTAAEPLFHDMDGKPVYIGDSVELVDEVIDEAIGQVVTVHRENTGDQGEVAMLAWLGKSLSDFFISDSREAGMAYPCSGVRKVEVQ